MLYWEGQEELVQRLIPSSLVRHSSVYRQTGYTLITNACARSHTNCKPYHWQHTHRLQMNELLIWAFDLQKHMFVPARIWNRHIIDRKRDYDLRVVEHHYSDGNLVYKLDFTTCIKDNGFYDIKGHNVSWIISCICFSRGEFLYPNFVWFYIHV